MNAPNPMATAVHAGLVEPDPYKRKIDDQAARNLSRVERLAPARDAPAPVAQHLDGDHADEVQRLARLGPIDYDRERDAAASKLGIRVSTLDAAVSAERKLIDPASDDPAASGHEVTFTEPEPWPDPVDVGALLDAIKRAINEYVRMRGAAAVACSLWIAHTWVHDAARVSPILAITSPEKRCGKTTTLEVLGSLVRRPMPASNITSAALFRAVEKFSPTLLIDEADTFLRASDELRGVLNSGHRRASAFVIRCVGDDQEPRRFRTWAPKAIALIGKLPETLADRSVEIALRRRGPGEKVKRWKGSVNPELNRKLARLAADHAGMLASATPALPDGLHDRAKDNWEPLLAIADLAGGKWPELARKAAVALSGDPADSAGTMLLTDVRATFAELHLDRISSAALCERLAALEDRPWPEWGHSQKPITARQVARLLAPYGVAPTQFRDSAGKQRGYERDAFNEAFSRYLPISSGTTVQPKRGAASSDFRSGTPNFPVPDEKALKRSCGAACTVVPDENGVQGRKGGNEGVEVVDL